jgi:uncharacterized protein YbaR (Trm112 family)
MENEKRMERNRKPKPKLRITEIPPSDEYDILECPYCKRALPVGIGADGTCKKVSTVCKFCKRKLAISADEQEAQKQQQAGT